MMFPSPLVGEGRVRGHEREKTKSLTMKDIQSRVQDK